jgi:serine O-acetyltransferase
VIHDIPPNCTVVGNPGHPVRVEGRRPEGPDADWIHLPDPIADAIKGLAARIAALEQAIEDGGANDTANVRALRSAERELRAAAADAGVRAGRSVGPNPAGG